MMARLLNVHHQQRGLCERIFSTLDSTVERDPPLTNVGIRADQKQIGV